MERNLDCGYDPKWAVIPLVVVIIPSKGISQDERQIFRSRKDENGMEETSG